MPVIDRQISRAAFLAIGVWVVFIGISRNAAPQDDKTSPPARSMAIAGTCVDENGNPLVDVPVALYRTDRGRSVKKLQTIRTDDHGHFHFPRLESLTNEDRANGYYSVLATSRGRASQIREYVTRESKGLVNFTMLPAATLGGRVTDPEGRSVSGALVWSRAPSDRPLEGVLSAITNSDGRFAITDLAPFDGAAGAGKKLPNGAVTGLTGIFINVVHPDFAKQRPICRGIPAELEIKLGHAGVLEGRVVDAVTGKPAPGILVSMQGTHLDKSGSWCEGKYRFAGLAPVPVNIWATAADRACAALDSVAVVAKETKALPDLKLVDGGWIEGRVLTLEDRPVRFDPGSRARLRIGVYGPSRPPSGAAVQSCVVDDEGRFRIRVPAGLNRPYVMSQAVKGQLATMIEVRDGETTTVTFRVVADEPVKEPGPEGDRAN
jgi:5-hydroxyisourate hydrolase-like protein (transthyretin family)